MKTQARKTLENLFESESITSTMTMVKAIGVGLLSFLLGGSSLFGAISPFSAAFVVSLPKKYIFTGVLGSIIGILTLGGSNKIGWLIFSAVLGGVGKLFLLNTTSKNSYKIKPILIGLLGFCVMLLPVFIQSLSSRTIAIDVILLSIQTILCGCFGYFFAIASDAIFLPQTNSVCSTVQLTSSAILVIATLCGACSFELFNLNLGVILGVIFVYLAINKYGIVGASVSSIVVAIALNLCSVDMLSFAAMLIISAFVAGAFSPLGKLAQISAFILVSAFCMVLLGVPLFMTYRVIDIFIATSFYILLPKKLMTLININPSEVNKSIFTGTMQQNVATKLSYASDTINDLKNELKSVSDKFGSIDYNNIGSISDACAHSVCAGCSRALDCWDRLYSDTMDGFNHITQSLKAVGRIEEATIPSFFTLRCCKLTRLIEAVNTYYEAFLAGQTAKRQLNESRKIVFEQFSSITDMLCEISDEIGQISGYDENIAKKAQYCFSKLEAEPLQTVCTIDKYGRTLVEIYTDNIVRTSPTVLCQAISSAADCIFDIPNISTVCGRTKISFFEKASYSADYSIQQVCCGDNSICGDSFEHFTDSRGYSYFLLSDGMGNGGRAAIDSTMTCSIMSKLLKAGFGVDSAIKLINSSLLVKSTDESLSTIDLARIDLYTGKVELFKSGAATTFVSQSGDISRISSSALPIGILQTAEFEKRIITLRTNDCFLLVSDGATQNGEGFIADKLKHMSTQGKTAKEIAIAICNEVKEHKAEQDDDVTVIAVRILKGI